MSSKLMRSTISTSFVWNFGAVVFRRVINVIAIPVIARLVSKEDYGNIQIIISTFMLLAVIRNSGFNDYYIKEADNRGEKFFSMFVNTMYLNTFVLAAIFIPALGIYRYFNDVSSTYTYLILIIVLLLINVGEIAGETYFRQKVLFKNIAIASSIKIFSYPLFTIIFLLIRADLFSLFAAFALSIVAEIISYFFFLPDSKVFLPDIKKMTEGFLLQFKERVFCFSVSAGMFISNFNVSFPIYLFAYAFSAEHSARYAISAQLVSMPFSLIIDSLSKVIYPVFIKQNEEERRRFYLTMLKFFPFVLFPMALWIMIYAQDVVHLFLGEKWLDVAPIIRIVSVPVFFNVLSSPLGPVATALGKPHYRVLWSGGSVLLALLLGSLGLQFGFLWGVAFVVLARVVTLIIWQVIACKMISLSHFKLVVQLSPYIPLWTMLAVLWMFFPEVSTYPYVRMFVAGTVGMILYFLLFALFFKDDIVKIKKLINDLFKRKVFK
ncbi:MAG: oligosaccharide flippase family protein [bacterium]